MQLDRRMNPDGLKLKLSLSLSKDLSLLSLGFFPSTADCCMMRIVTVETPGDS